MCIRYIWSMNEFCLDSSPIPKASHGVYVHIFQNLKEKKKHQINKDPKHRGSWAFCVRDTQTQLWVPKQSEVRGSLSYWRARTKQNKQKVSRAWKIMKRMEKQVSERKWWQTHGQDGVKSLGKLATRERLLPLSLKWTSQRERGKTKQVATNNGAAKAQTRLEWG